ncbi:hypothetical protein ACFQX7_28030 [Luedemannella flava]
MHLPLPNPEAFWAWYQSHGVHALWLALPEAAREAFRHELFDGLSQMQSADGIVLDHAARSIRARRP